MGLNMDKKIKIGIAIVTVISVGVLCAQAMAAVKISKSKFSRGKSTISRINIQSKPTVKSTKVGTLKKGIPVKVLYRAGDWYAIRKDKTHLVGYVSAKYMKKYVKPKPASPKQPSLGGIPGSNSGSNTGSNAGSNAGTGSGAANPGGVVLSSDEKSVLDLINAERAKGGLKALTPDDKIMAAAREKAKEMVNKNYFSHESPTYGSPFNMMEQFGVVYKTAGENIAGNSNNAAAVAAWMNSSGHRANIMNGNFNYTGIGVVASPVYGKVYVQMFVGR